MRVLLFTALFLTLWCARADHLIVGNIAARTVLTHEELVKYKPIPFLKRVKYYFYSDPRQRPIQGIQAIDTLHTRASINITAGGLGQPFVNLRMKSVRGSGLAYNIGIYVSPDYQ